MTETTPRPDRGRGGRILIVVATALAVALVAAIALLWPRDGAPSAAPGTSEPSSPPTVPSIPSPTPTLVPAPMPTPTFDRTAHSIDDPASIWVVVNKARPLKPTRYAPADLVKVDIRQVNPASLRKEAARAAETMFAAFAKETGKQMANQSAYRSYSAQVSVYNGWVSSRGQAYADSHSARPGFSEHQTGLAFDISAVPAECTLAECFADTAQGRWLAENAYRYGFILRYPKGLQKITGYAFEPWHYRYVGIELATEMHDEGVATLEEFFGLPAAPDYGP